MRWIPIWPHYCIIIGWTPWLPHTHTHIYFCLQAVRCNLTERVYKSYRFLFSFGTFSSIAYSLINVLRHTRTFNTASAKSKAVYEEMLADIFETLTGHGQTLLITSGMCATSPVWPKDFACCFLLMSAFPSRRVCLVVFTTYLAFSFEGNPLINFCLWEDQIAALGFQNNTSSSRDSERW